MAANQGQEADNKGSAGKAQTAADADSLESCVLGLFNEIIGRMNKDISEVLRPKTSEVASAVNNFQTAVATKTAEIGQLEEITTTDLATAAVAVQEFQNRIASELGAIPGN